MNWENETEQAHEAFYEKFIENYLRSMGLTKLGFCRSEGPGTPLEGRYILNAEEEREGWHYYCTLEVSLKNGIGDLKTTRSKYSPTVIKEDVEIEPYLLQFRTWMLNDFVTGQMKTLGVECLSTTLECPRCGAPMDFTVYSNGHRHTKCTSTKCEFGSCE